MEPRRPSTGFFGSRMVQVALMMEPMTMAARSSACCSTRCCPSAHHALIVARHHDAAYATRLADWKKRVAAGCPSNDVLLSKVLRSRSPLRA